MPLKFLIKKRMLFAMAGFAAFAGAYPSTYQVTLHIDGVNLAFPSIGAAHLQNVQNAVSRFGATAILLYVPWNGVQDSVGHFHWATLDSALYNIVQVESLNVTIRVGLGGSNIPAWARHGGGVLTDDDYMQIQTGAVWVTDSGRVSQPSFASAASRQAIANSLDSIARHVTEKMNLYGPDHLLDITPVLTHTDEFTYPADGGLAPNDAVDYSPPAITGFYAFLRAKYGGSIAVLNKQWSSGPDTANFADFEDIHPKAMNWHLAPGDTTIGGNIFHYAYYVGRRDWYQYRQQNLKIMIDTLAQIVHSNTLTGGNSVRFGFQPAAATQNWNNGASPMERQGWYDFTPLMENVDWVHVSSTPEFGKDMWAVEADYLRSMCRFWHYKNGRDIRFTDETNWPTWPDTGAGGSELYSNTRSYTRKAKSDADSAQARTFKDKGSSGHVVVGWANINSMPLTNYYDGRRVDSVYLDFSSLTGFLKHAANDAIISVNNSNAVHVSSSRVAVDLGNFFPGLNLDSVVNHTTHTLNYPAFHDRLPQEIIPVIPHLPGRSDTSYVYGFYNTSNCDFITDYMINVDGGEGIYIRSYSTIYLPNGSYHMYNDPYDGYTLENLLQAKDTTVTIANATRFLTGLGHFPLERWHIIPGTQLFAGSNSPDVLRMIWRTSTSLDPHKNQWQYIWPDGNNLTADTAILHANILSDWDFIQFAVENDAPAVDAFQNVSIGFGNWDQQAINLWNGSGLPPPDSAFSPWAESMWPDGYNCSGCSGTHSSEYTYLDWLKEFGAPGDPFFSKWGPWPYGNPPGLSKAPARKKITPAALVPYFEVSQAGKQISFALKNSAQQAFSVELYDIHGRVLFRSKTVASRAPIDLSRFSSGVYFYNVSAGKDLTKKGKFAFH